DGTVSSARVVPSADGPTVLFLHGVMASSAEHVETARLLHEATGGTVVSLDLRGHGESGGRPGDVDRIGQYEEDVVDVMAALRRKDPARRLILSGHSMGGGIAMRVVARKDAPEVDGYLLFAPHLGEASPTTRNEPAKGDHAGASILKLHVPRLIGL